jgi:RNA polymerase sigma factor for flagellar operon FliA
MGLLSEILKKTNRNTLWPKTKPGKERPLNTNQLKQILEKMGLEEGYKILTEREKQIIYAYYLEGYKDEEIAAFYGINQQNVNRQRKRGIAKLKIIKSF